VQEVAWPSRPGSCCEVEEGWMDTTARFLFEIGHMKRVARSGWWVAGVRQPESIAEHSFRCTWIGFFLARSEGVDPGRVVMMCLAHDVQEARINDQHKVGQRYLDPKPIEGRVFADQIAGLPDAEDLAALHAEFLDGRTPAARVARDADRLECAFQALEYVEEGHEPCRDWFTNTEAALTTTAGRALFEKLKGVQPSEWYRALPGHMGR